MTKTALAPPAAINVAGYPLIAPPPATSGTWREPSFSIVIAAYNCADTVSEALQSVLGQTARPAQVIVCDDGSTDATAVVLAGFKPDIVVLQQEHRGAATARNACLAAATATHIVSFDADDILLSTCLEAYGAALVARPDLQIVTCDAYLEAAGKVFDRYYRRTAHFAVQHQRRAALHQHFIFGHAAVDRDAAIRVGGWNERFTSGSDTDFFLRLILDGATAGLVWEPLAIYRLRTDSLSSNRARSLREMVDIVESAARHPSLSAAEREAIRVDLNVKERLATLAEFELAIQTDAAEARQRGLAIASSTDGRFTRRTRAKALGAAALPRTTHHLLRLRDRRTKATLFAARTRNT